MFESKLSFHLKIIVTITIIATVMASGYFVLTNRSRPLSSSSVEKCLNSINSGNVEEINSVLHFLAERHPEPSLRNSIETLGNHADPMIRFSVVRVIAGFQDQRALDYLEQYLYDIDPEVAEEADRGMENIKISIGRRSGQKLVDEIDD